MINLIFINIKNKNDFVQLLQYGYQLPTNEQDLWFFKIKFYDQQSETLVYPNICVLARPPKFFRSNNSVVTIQNFLRDMIKVLPKICGQPLNILPLNQKTVHRKFN